MNKSTPHQYFYSCMENQPISRKEVDEEVYDIEYYGCFDLTTSLGADDLFNKKMVSMKIDQIPFQD